LPFCFRGGSRTCIFCANLKALASNFGGHIGQNTGRLMSHDQALIEIYKRIYIKQCFMNRFSSILLISAFAGSAYANEDGLGSNYYLGIQDDGRSTVTLRQITNMVGQNRGLTFKAPLENGISLDLRSISNVKLEAAASFENIDHKQREGSGNVRAQTGFGLSVNAILDLENIEKLKPYVGLGVVFEDFWGQLGSFGDRDRIGAAEWAYQLRIGMDYSLNSSSSLFLGGQVETNTTAINSSAAGFKADYGLNSLSISFGFSHRF
jgi:opacity protein-like surface antigen